jgi:formylglycine-generating enzyme required for sulfatase activity
MALANVGCALARNPKLSKPVLVVDWDLEAPGLHRYFRKQVSSAFHGDDGSFNQALGLIDLFVELRDRLPPDDGPSKAKLDFAAAASLLEKFPLADYVIETDIPQLHLLKAGRFDEYYARKIATFEWAALYRSSPHLLKAFAAQLARNYSFVLIDSRTGLTDTSGICTMLMPEVLVAVFTPNRQSLLGLVDLVREAALYRAASDDLRPLLVYPLPSRIESLEPALRQSWRYGDPSADVPSFQRLFEQTFKEIYDLSACDLSSYFDEVQIQHVPSFAYGEEIALLVEKISDRFSLTQSYLRLSARLEKGEPPWASPSSAEETIEPGIALGDRANQFLAQHPGAEDALKRIMTHKLATVRDDGEPMRRRALRAEFSDEEWRLVSELSDDPSRLLVTATTEAGETYAEVAHEAIFRSWDKLKGWITSEREFLAWRSGLEASRRAWQKTPERDKNDTLLRGLPLTQAQSWLAERSEDIPDADRVFIVESQKGARRRKHRVQALVGLLFAATALGFAAWWNQEWLKEEIYAMANVSALTTAQERALKAGDSIKECVDCPEMIVAPAGHFMMGSPPDQGNFGERPQHEVTIAKPFAVAKFELTFDAWDACADHGDCVTRVIDNGWGRGRRPTINVSWDDAQTYVKWLSRITGKGYRLLSEAEYEYAARAGTQTVYPWGDDIKLDGKAMANCKGCGSQWDGKETAPVGSFVANGFGFYDMVGNVWSWTEDCWNATYQGAPADGSAWTTGDCTTHVLRSGSWTDVPDLLRSAARIGNATGSRTFSLGFRVARTLSP